MNEVSLVYFSSCSNTDFFNHLSFQVFGMLLGDTIILDNLDCANSYRQEVCQSSSRTITCVQSSVIELFLPG